jgi:hypothetical protein
VNHHALPRKLYWQMKLDKKATGVQLTLDGALKKPEDVKMYTRDGATHAVAQFVACDDQVRMMMVLGIDVDAVGPGSCYYREANFSQLSCCYEA